MIDQRFRSYLYGSDLSDPEKDYLESVSAVALGAVITGTFVASAIMEKATKQKLQVRIRQYEELHPEIPKYSQLKKETRGLDITDLNAKPNKYVQSVRTDDGMFVFKSDSFFDKNGKHVFAVTYQKSVVPSAFRKKELPPAGLKFVSQSELASVHGGYYFACWCSRHDRINTHVSQWMINVEKKWKESQKEKRTVKESVDLFSDDNIVRAGVVAGLASQGGRSYFNNQEQTLRKELQQIQAKLSSAEMCMSPAQKNLLMARSGIILDELARAERRKGTATAIRNAALMVAASAQIRKMYNNYRTAEINAGPDNPEMLKLIGGIPEWK